MPRDYKLYLEDILDATQKIQFYTADITFQKLQDNPMLLDAVLYNLEIIGEAVKHVPPALKKSYPDIEWRRIAGLRDIVAHEYFGVSLEIIWDILQNKLPELNTRIKMIMKEQA